MLLVKLYEKLVKHFGNQQKTADALGCSQTAVFKWVNGKTYMSSAIANRAQKITEGKFQAADLCPDLKEYQSMMDEQRSVEDEVNG